MRIYPAELKDLDTIIELGEKTYRQHFSHIWSESGIAAFIAAQFDRPAMEESLRARTTTYLLATDDCNVCTGFAKLNWNVRIPHTDTCGAELQKLYFLKECTGHGTGKQMIMNCVETARAHGETTLWLDVLKTNGGAKKFYEANGFTGCGELDFGTDLHEIGLYVMKMAI